MSLLTKFLGIYQRSGWRGSYRLSDFLSHRLKSLQCLQIETESGILYADLRISSSRTIMSYPKCRTGEEIAMRKFVKRGDTAFDIGSHFGFYTLILSEIVGETGKVFAFEPNIELLPSLKKTLEPLANVKLETIALSDNNGTVNLFVPEDASMASLVDWTQGAAGNVHGVSCEMRYIDDLVESGKLPFPQFIKCDVEGAELSIFTGGKKVLNRTDAPIIMFEVITKAAKAFGADTNAYFDFLKSLEHPGYSFFEVTSDGIKNLKSTEIEYANVVGIPESKRDLFANILPD